MRLGSTQALIEEISSTDSQIIPVKTVVGKGKAQGTYVVRELVYAYATWISPAFFLTVLRTFDAVATGRTVPERPEARARHFALLSVAIGDNDLPILLHQGVPVLTLTMMDGVHQRPPGTTGQNFKAHRERLALGEDYFLLEHPAWIGAGGLILLTESGYLTLAQGYTEDFSRQVQGQMARVYFGARQIRPDAPDAKLADSLLFCLERMGGASYTETAYIVDYMLKVLLFKRDNPPPTGLPYPPGQGGQTALPRPGRKRRPRPDAPA